MEKLPGSLISYHMRKSKQKSTTRYVAFKEDKSIEYKENSCSKTDIEEGKFIRRLKKDTYKYKGKVPFKFFEFGRAGNYALKFPYKKEEKNLSGKKRTHLTKYSRRKTFKIRDYMQKKMIVHLKDPMNPLVKMKLLNLF